MKDAIGWLDRLDIWHPLTLIPHWQIGSNPSSDFLTVTSTKNLFVLGLENNLLMWGGENVNLCNGPYVYKELFQRIVNPFTVNYDCSCPHVLNSLSALLKLEIAWLTVSDAVTGLVIIMLTKVSWINSNKSILVIDSNLFNVCY